MSGHAQSDGSVSVVGIQDTADVWGVEHRPGAARRLGCNRCCGYRNLHRPEAGGMRCDGCHTLKNLAQDLEQAKVDRSTDA